MSSRYLSIVVGLFAGLATAFFAVIAGIGSGSSRQPDPAFDVDLFATPTLSPTVEATGTQTERQPLDRLIERLEDLRDTLQSSVRSLPPTPVPGIAPEDSGHVPSDGGCETERSEEDGVTRTSLRCEHRVVSDDGSVSISSTSETSVSSTSPDSP